MVKRIGFLINPIAGMGGRVGLKGTDGVVKEAKKLGAKSVAPFKAKQTLQEFLRLYKESEEIEWVTCKGVMGEHILKEAKLKSISIIYNPNIPTSAEDTKLACKEFKKHYLDLLVFCGGDGTARDIFSIVGTQIPLLGIPSGVKMHSGVFGVSTKATAKILHEFLSKNLIIGDVDILDLDEDKYRKGEWNIRLFGIAKGIIEPTYIQVGKSTFESVSDDSVKEEIAEYIEEEMQNNEDTLFLMGSGGTIDFIARYLHLENTLLGIDPVYQMKTIQKDVNEAMILKLLKKYKKCKVILSPIGAQGFILGRGNLQLSPQVIKSIGLENILIVSTPSKLKHTPVLRVDTGDAALDKQFKEKDYYMVIIGYRLSRIVKIQSNNL